MARFAYLTGWRIPSEVLPPTWDRVDFGAGIVTLNVGTTKTGAGRTFPFSASPALRSLLEQQRTHTRAIERRTGAIIPRVFHRDGQPILDIYTRWHSASRRAAVRRRGALEEVVRPALLERVPHDLRRTAVRNLVRAGVSEHTAMKLTGHKTRAIFDRYDIVDERDLAAGVAKVSAYREARAAAGAQ